MRAKEIIQQRTGYLKDLVTRNITLKPVNENFVQCFIFSTGVVHTTESYIVFDLEKALKKVSLSCKHPSYQDYSKKSVNFTVACFCLGFTKTDLYSKIIISNTPRYPEYERKKWVNSDSRITKVRKCL